jgi:hypothetical protein
MIMRAITFGSRSHLAVEQRRQIGHISRAALDDVRAARRVASVRSYSSSITSVSSVAASLTPRRDSAASSFVSAKFTALASSIRAASAAADGIFSGSAVAAGSV